MLCRTAVVLEGARMLLEVFLVLLVLLIAVALSWLRIKTAAGSTLRDVTGRILLITAHPDDECMFFAPTVLSLGRSVRAELFLLCLSEGNHYGEGEVRKKELLHSAAILGISGTHIEIVNDLDLPDSPKVEWKAAAIEKYVLSAIHNCTISKIITFDESGVSGHSNHTAIHSAVLRMSVTGKLRSAGVGEVLLLESTSLLRKYGSLIDAAWGSLTHRDFVLSSIEEYWLAKQAMQAHSSQYLWFRRLYVLLSRYMILNTFQRLKTATCTNCNAKSNCML